MGRADDPPCLALPCPAQLEDQRDEALAHHLGGLELTALQLGGLVGSKCRSLGDLANAGDPDPERVCVTSLQPWLRLHGNSPNSLPSHHKLRSSSPLGVLPERTSASTRQHRVLLRQLVDALSSPILLEPDCHDTEHGIRQRPLQGPGLLQGTGPCPDRTSGAGSRYGPQEATLPRSLSG